MKRVVVSLLVAAGLTLPTRLQVARGAEVDAQDFLFLKQTVESQQETIDGLKRRLAAVESQLAEIRREADKQGRTITTLTKDLVTQDQLRVLDGKVEQVDTNRANDSKRIFETLKKFAEAPVPSAPVSPPSNSPPDRRNGRTPVEPTEDEIKPETKPDNKPVKPPVALPAESYQHVIKLNETLSEILVAYRKEYGLKTTMAHLEAANPGINPRKLKEGQKITIPIVK